MRDLVISGSDSCLLETLGSRQQVEAGKEEREERREEEESGALTMLSWQPHTEGYWGEGSSVMFTIPSMPPPKTPPISHTAPSPHLPDAVSPPLPPCGRCLH